MGGRTFPLAHVQVRGSSFTQQHHSHGDGSVWRLGQGRLTDAHRAPGRARHTCWSLRWLTHAARVVKDTENQNDVRLGDELGLTAAVDVALKQTQQRPRHPPEPQTSVTLANKERPSYNLAGAGVLVCVRRPSDVIPHLSRRHDQHKALKQKENDAESSIIVLRTRLNSDRAVI